MQIETIPTRTHERVLRCTDADSGLRAFIALHDTTLGPGLGGCRMWPYDSEKAALADVLRLSAGMTAKSALAGVPFGGGKAVVIGDARRDKTPALLRALGRFVETLKGAFITGEDVGMSPADMEIAALETRHITGRSSGPFASGDPSPVTADGVFRCMEVAVRHRLGGSSLRGCTVAVQGLGHVGMALAARLHGAGARIVAADLDPQATARAAADFGARIVPPEAILSAPAEVFAPCALGGVLAPGRTRGLRAAIVCGSANNQLADDACTTELFEHGVLYCPDYVVNAGGLISVAREALRIADADWSVQKLDAAIATFDSLVARALRESRPPLEVADAMVAQVLEAARRGQRSRAI